MPLPEKSYSYRPDRILMLTDSSVDTETNEELAQYAVQQCQASMPKISGRLSMTLRPAFGTTYWGIYFPDRKVWYLEKGTNPFTMNSLAGKVVPMWVDDPDGSQAKEIGRKAKTRMSVDGRRQTLIFRRAAKKGQRKMVKRKGVWRSVPMSYPGAPGRISNRLSSGRIGTPNGGVRWRHPGIDGRGYLNDAMLNTAVEFGLQPSELLLVDSATFALATRS